VKLGPVLAAALALGSTACEQEPPPEQELAQAAEQVGFGDIANLGPHRLDASITRAVILDGERDERSQEQVQLVWRDWDNFQHARRRGGEIISQVIVEDGSARVRRADGSFEQASDVEPHRVELRMAWDVWGLGLSAFDESLQLDHLGEGILEGRSARQYQVGLVPDAGPGNGRVVPVSLEGNVWLDELTAVRLMAEVTGRWHHRNKPHRVNEVKVILVRTDFGLAGAQGAWGATGS
jgi:hypothetical protein